MFIIVDSIEDDVERITLSNRVREILMQAYKIGFEASIQFSLKPNLT